MSQRGDKEFDKFIEGDGGEVCLRIKLLRNPHSAHAHSKGISALEQGKFVTMADGSIAVQTVEVS